MNKTEETSNDIQEDKILTEAQPVRSYAWLFKILGVAFVALAVVGITAYVLLLEGIRSSSQNDEKYQALEKKIAEMSLQLKAYSDASEKRLDEVQDAQTKVEQDLAHVSVPNLPAPDLQVIEELKSKVEQLENDLAKRQDQVAKIPETLGLFEKLHDRMQSSKPFEKELGEAKILFSSKDEDMQKRLQLLEAYGQNGVPSVEQLALEFKPIAKELMNLSISDDMPWYERFGQRLRNLVIIRKHGQDIDETAPVNERIDGILYLMEIGNVEGALAEADLLPPLNLDAYTQWRTHADQRLYIEQSLPIMEAHALAHVLSGNQDSNIKGE